MGMMMKFKGFIGPLGDDIPSIFPIVFSVLLFTGSVLYANQIVSEKAKAIQINEGAMALSYLLTEKGFVELESGEPSLKKVCDEKVKPRASSLGVKFLITLKRFCKGIPADPLSSDSQYNPYGGVKASPFYIE